MIKKNKKLTQIFSQWLSFQSRSNKKDELKLHKPKKIAILYYSFLKKDVAGGFFSLPKQ